MERQKESQIKETTKWLMFGTAIFFDTLAALANFIPLIGQISSFFINMLAIMTFWLWLKMAGMKFSPQKLIALSGGSIIEMIPILNALPAWTAVIIYLTRVEKIIDKTVGQIPGGNKIVSAIKK